MNKRRAFDIPFVGLKPGEHSFEFFIEDAFFETYPTQDFSNCKVNVRLTLDKKNGLMLLRFEMEGSVDVVCDRCGNQLPLDLWDEFNIVVKLVDDPDRMNEQEEDPDMFYIAQGSSHLHIADWVYEFITLSMPMQKQCSEAQIGGVYCNKEVLQMLQQMKPDIDNN